MKIECVHADTCLPDYWSGHHLPHVAIPVWSNMSTADVRRSILNELAMGAVAGADYDYNDEKWYRMARAAVNRLRSKTRHPFRHVQDDDEDGDTVMAYFVFRQIEQ